jgi:hypothetical protein
VARVFSVAAEVGLEQAAAFRDLASDVVAPSAADPEDRQPDDLSGPPRDREAPAAGEKRRLSFPPAGSFGWLRQKDLERRRRGVPGGGVPTTYTGTFS